MQKNKWWADRKKAAESVAAGHNFKAFPTVPIPAWKYGKSVSLDSLKSVTDSYVKTLEPKRKLVLPVLPATVKDSLAAFTASIKQDKSLPEIQNMLVQALADKAVVEENGRMLEGFKVRFDMPESKRLDDPIPSWSGRAKGGANRMRSGDPIIFSSGSWEAPGLGTLTDLPLAPRVQFVSHAAAARMLAHRRAQVHDRYLKLWAKKVLVSPESAVVPLKEVDYQLASKFEVRHSGLMVGSHGGWPPSSR